MCGGVVSRLARDGSRHSKQSLPIPERQPWQPVGGTGRDRNVTAPRLVVQTPYLHTNPGSEQAICAKPRGTVGSR
jgi:hypothetical protein